MRTDRKKRKEHIIKNVDTHKTLILDAERWLWAHPQTGYTEWEAHEYLRKHFEAMGYSLTLSGNIPGFYTDIDTKRPGPKVCIMAELDALELPNHPQAQKGIIHACGHHAQGAALLGVAAALKEPGALDGLCGSIRLMAVPAEEVIQLSFRENLRRQGVIRYTEGKVEYLSRGYFDDVDMAVMVHGHMNSGEDSFDFVGNAGNNGCIAKEITYKGKAAHAGGAPHEGVNAQYAAMLGLQACNDLRETFQEKDAIRFHPVMQGANCAVNIIPEELRIESYVRGKNLEAMKRENRKINRALTGGALAMGAGVEICDRPGCAPEYHDTEFLKLVEQCCIDLSGREKVNFDYNKWVASSSDFGDITCVMPGVQFYVAGASGTVHGVDYCVTNPERFCLNAAKALLFVVLELPSEEGMKAKKILEQYEPIYPSIQAYLEAINEVILDKNAVIYDENGNVKIDYM